MTILNGKLFAESPIYRGNARKTLFTRDGNGMQRLVSLAGEISGTAQTLMDAFIGSSRDNRNKGLLNRLWERLYSSPLPQNLIQDVSCQLHPQSYPKDHFFDLRMGIRLNEDRAAAEANANYKFETLLRNSVFAFSMNINDEVLQKGDHAAKLFYLLQELSEGRFWFGAGKSKGLGRCRLELDLPFTASQIPISINPNANHLQISTEFDADNPILVGWNWGKLNPEIPSFTAVDGRSLVSAMRQIPTPVRKRLESLLSGPILNAQDWKRQFSGYFLKVIAVWLRENAVKEIESWVLSAGSVAKLTKGKHPLSKKVIKALEPIIDQPFESQDALIQTLQQALGTSANMIDRITKIAETHKKSICRLDPKLWQELVASFDLTETPPESVTSHIQDETRLIEALTQELRPVLSRLFSLIDQQIRLAQSDTWVELEVTGREEHLHIKKMLREASIPEDHWGDPLDVPEGVSPAAWREFTESHKNVGFQHMRNERNLNKSMTNDKNFIAFLMAYREKARQELAQPDHIDFRAGGAGNREFSKTYGKPYDNIFMRMLCWEPDSPEEPKWSVYIPGSTIKGAFRKRASQILKTLWGEGANTEHVLTRIFGQQGKRGLVFFSDAYLVDTHTSERYWCVMDGVRMDPKTGAPIEEAKADYLFAYGDQLRFRLQMDIQDIGAQDEEALSVLKHLFRDFQRGDIPLGGLKTNGFGWIKARIKKLTWLTGHPNGIGPMIVGNVNMVREGLWYKAELDEEAASAAMTVAQSLPTRIQPVTEPLRTNVGYISHRAFGGYCGMLTVEAEVLSPTCIRESGEPSFRATLPEGTVNGWDFFSISPAEIDCRNPLKNYAIPSKTIKGMIRHIYSIVSDSRKESTDLARLNPSDSLFGWVGSGPNQSIMGRLSFEFASFENASLSWFKVPYPYGNWRFSNGSWKKIEKGFVTPVQIEKTWRIFPQVPIPEFVQELEDFRPDTLQAAYFRAMKPGTRTRFTVRFWNLTREELQRLIWCIELDEKMVHKTGRFRHLGFGSLRLHLLPDSYLIDWKTRYAGSPETEWQIPIQPEQWRNLEVISHYARLKQVMYVD